MSSTCNLTLDNIQGIAGSVLRVVPYYSYKQYMLEVYFLSRAQIRDVTLT